jgi:hypothetical protein
MGMKLMNNEWSGMRQAASWVATLFAKNAKRMGHRIAVCVLATALAATALAQAVSTTTVLGTVYLANGQAGAGTLTISWPAFTTAAGQAVAADSTTVTIGPDGFVSVNLAPNVGATPAGEYYTVVFYMSDGSTSTQYWVVPAAAQATLAQVQANLMPAAQAVQTVSKAYVDQAIAELSQSAVTASGGTLSGPLYLSGDPTQPLQAADKHYVDTQVSSATANAWPAQVFRVDQFPGADIGAKIQACVNAVNPGYGGTCDARNFTGSLSMGSNLTISTGNVAVLLPCATISTANQIVVTAGTRNVSLHGCALRGGTAASGSTGGTAFAYSGAGATVQVGDPAFATDTTGFHMDNVVINTTAATSATAQGLVAYRTQEMELESLYFLGNFNQTGMTLDGTGNYTGGTFLDDEFGGFGTAVNAIGHQVANAATTDWMNASTFVRLHIDCPTSNGGPINGTYGINLQQGDGNTFTGGDVEGCSTALHLGSNAQNNTIVGLRNENSTNQVIADAGSAYNNWMTGGTMFTGKLTDNGTRNSFLDTFHRSFNALNGDWYGSQQDATLTNHFRLGIGLGNERGLLNEIQTDYGYRWLYGFSDATGGQQLYQLQDLLNNVYRLQIQQWNPGQSSTNNQTALNAAGTGNVCFNCSTNSGTGGVTFASGGASPAAVATVDNAGNAQFVGTLQIGGTTQSAGSITVRNNADAEVDYSLWPGLTTSQKGSLTYKDWNGNSQWYLVKDASNNWALNSATGGLDSFKAYQSTNSGDTYIDASNSTGHIRLNYETGSGAETDIYSGSSSSLDAAFLAPNAIKFPGLAASSGDFCLQIDNSGYITNTGSPCGSGSGGVNGTINSGSTGQIAYYTTNGTAIGGMSAVPLTAGGTGANSASGALQNLLPGVASDGNHGFSVEGNAAVAKSIPAVSPYLDIRAYGAVIDGATPINTALNNALAACPSSYSPSSSSSGNSCQVLLPCGGLGCYLAPSPAIVSPYASQGSVVQILLQGALKLGATLQDPGGFSWTGSGGQSQVQWQSQGPTAQMIAPQVSGTMGTACASANTACTFTPTFTQGSIANVPVGSSITIAGTASCAASVTRTAYASAPGNVTATCSTYTRIPPIALVNVSCPSDSSFNVTGAPLYAVDFPNHTLTWTQTTGSGTTTTGCAVTGFNEDSFESAQIVCSNGTGSGSYTCSAGQLTIVPVHTHSGSDLWGEVAYNTSQLAHTDIENIAITGCQGACFQGLQDAGTVLIGDAFSPADAMTGLGAEFTGTFYNTKIDASVFMANINWSNCFSNCSQPTYPAGIRFDALPSAITGLSAPGGSGMQISNSVVMGSIWAAGNQYMGVSRIYLPEVTNTVIERGVGALLVIDPRYGGNNIQPGILDSVQVSDPLAAGFDTPLNGAQKQSLVAATDQGGIGGFVAIRGNPYFYSERPVNSYYQGQFSTDNANHLTLPVGRGVPVGSLTNGAQDEIEHRNEGASLGPSVVPYATLPIGAYPAAWYCTGCSMTTVPGPDGAATSAVEVDSTFGGGQANIGSDYRATYAGDQYIFGAWAAPGANETGLTSDIGSPPLLLASAGTDIFNGGSSMAYAQAFDMQLGSEHWHPVVAVAKITTGDATAHYIRFDLKSGSAARQGNQFFQPFWIYIPASANIPQAEVERWRQDLLHGAVPQNFNNPGVAVTTEPVAAPGFDILNPVTGGIAPFGTVNLADWTDIGVANGNVPVWNSTTGKWTPGSLPSSVSSINGSSGAFTFTGSGVSCSGTTCTVAGSTASGNVQAGSQYSPTYYNQGGSGTTVGGVTPFTGLGYWSASAPPAAATAAQIVSAIGPTPVANATSATSATSATTATTATNFSGSLAGDVTGTQNATMVGKINGGAVPVSASVLGTNTSGQPVSVGTTGSGSVMLATSPTMSAPTVSGTATMQGNVTLQNGANANQTLAIQPGTSADQVGAVQFNNYSGAAEWQLRKDATNYLRVTDAANSLDRAILPPNANTTINAGAGANAVVINNTSGSGTGGFIVYEGGSNSSTAAFQVTGSGNTTATGFLQGKFIMGTGTMTMAAGAAAGSGPTIACATSHLCDGVSGTVTLTTGTSPTTGTLATLNFPNTHTNQANCIVTTQSSTAVITTNTWMESTTAITITANTAPAASTAYTIKYWCGGY